MQSLKLFDVFLLSQSSSYIIQILHHNSLVTQRRVERGSSRRSRASKDALMFPKWETHLVLIAVSHCSLVKTWWLPLVELPAAVSLQTSIQGDTDQEKGSQICYMEQKLDLHFYFQVSLKPGSYWRPWLRRTLRSYTSIQNTPVIDVMAKATFFSSWFRNDSDVTESVIYRDNEIRHHRTQKIRNHFFLNDSLFDVLPLLTFSTTSGKVTLILMS